ncbi:uncharacterized protein CTRU02_211322 [Colletotrichum truncatum]|uniref:Uncharacterized protein n=1 Tax=Colletotrichum truncatum TaxID=5467 RepID=A0ACC3YRF1_COLTU
MPGAFSVRKVILFCRTHLRRYGTLQTLSGVTGDPKPVGGCCVEVDCLGAVLVLRVAACGSPVVVVTVLSIDMSYFAACSQVFHCSRGVLCGHLGPLWDVESRPRMALHRRGLCGREHAYLGPFLLRFSKISFSLLLMFFFQIYAGDGRDKGRPAGKGRTMFKSRDDKKGIRDTTLGMSAADN